MMNIYDYLKGFFAIFQMIAFMLGMIAYLSDRKIELVETIINKANGEI